MGSPRAGVLLFAAASVWAAAGCSSVCVDDGAVFKQSLEACMAAATAGQNTEGATGSTESATATATEGLSESATEGPTGSASNSASNSASESESASETDSETVTAGMTGAMTTGAPGGAWCEDTDGDGFGDPDSCVPAEPGGDPPAGFVPNDDDCADGDPYTFPGAAPHDSETACMTDVDGDDWGETDPDHPDAVPGTDCDDDDPYTFPGAAPNDSETACMTDIDGDDWGENTPDDPEVTPGTDCDDEDPANYPGQPECMLPS